MREKGASHVEIILSFLLFASAVVVAFYFFSPGAGNQIVDTSITYAFSEIKDNVTKETYFVSFQIKPGSYPAENIVGFSISEDIPDELAPIAKDESGAELLSYRPVGSSVTYISSDDWAESNRVFLVYSEEFSSSTLSGNTLDSSEYEIASKDSRKVVSELEFIRLKEYYDENYFVLKEQFNLPGRVNFGFSILLPSGFEIRAEREIPEGLEVFSESERVEILTNSGEIEYGDLKIWIW